MTDIFVSTFPFAREDHRPAVMLAQSGFLSSGNPFGRKLDGRELAELAADARVLIAGTEDTTTLIRTSRRLRLIARVGIGLDSVPLAECKERGIQVCYTPNAVTPAVAELSIGLMLDATRRITFSDRELRAGGWTRPYGRRLGDSVVGIVGFGKIGAAVAKLLRAFEPREILIYDKEDRSERIRELSAIGGPPFRQTSLEDLLRSSDIVSLHIPLTGKTRGLIDYRSLTTMKPTAAIINTARGGVINEDDLFRALQEGAISAAAVDVFDQEPYTGRLVELDNAVLTQHMASCAYDCRARMETEAVTDAIRFLNDQPLINEVPAEEYAYQLE